MHLADMIGKNMLMQSLQPLYIFYFTCADSLSDGKMKPVHTGRELLLIAGVKSIMIGTRYAYYIQYYIQRCTSVKSLVEQTQM